MLCPKIQQDVSESEGRSECTNTERKVATYIEVADQDLDSRQIVADDKARDLRVHYPMQHTDASAYKDRTQVCVEMNCHHCLVCTDERSSSGKVWTELTGVFAIALDAQARSNLATSPIASDDMS